MKNRGRAVAGSEQLLCRVTKQQSKYLGFIAMIPPSALSLIKVSLSPSTEICTRYRKILISTHYALLLIDVMGEKEGIENRTGSASATSEHVAQSHKLCWLRRQG